MVTSKTVQVGHFLCVSLCDPTEDGKWLGGSIRGSLAGPDDPESYLSMIDALESVVLGHACAGVAVDDPAYVEGLQTAIESCANNS